jgi:hypothetical protein
MKIVTPAEMRPPSGHQGNVGLRSYSQEEMLEYARLRGLPLSAWTFRDWIRIGLLGTASDRTFPGRGHGSGSAARWSSQQFGLFQLVLAQKQSLRHECNAPYCNLPVWRWLYWGDQADVGLQQVKRALRTWQQWYRKNAQNKRSVRKHVRELVAMTASRHAIGTRDLVNDLTEMALDGESLDEATLREMFALIIDPRGVGEARGPMGRQFTPEEMGRRISLQALASQLDLENLPEPLWELARVGQLLARYRYQLAQAERESSARASHEHPLPRASLHALMDSSCFLLLYMLAILKRGPHPCLQENLQPRAWLTGAAKATITTVPIPMSLMLPNGLPVLRLQIEVTIQHRTPWSFSFALPYI